MVIDRMTYGHGVVRKRFSYANDLERVLSELNLTTSLLEKVTPESFLEIEDRRYQPEELINYYAGIFFDQVHQIKDKLLNLIMVMEADDKSPKAYNEMNAKFKVSRVLKQKEELFKKIGIYEEVKKWDEDSGSIFGQVLKKRSLHHHYLGRLQLNFDFQRIKMSRTMLEPGSLSYLNDYGRKKMEEIREQSFEKFKSDILSKQHNTIIEIEANVEKIANRIANYYKVPTSQTELAKMSADYNRYLSSLKIKNNANIKNIKGPIGEMIRSSVVIAKKLFGDLLVSIYLVGSCGRGEFIPLVSDVNFIFVLKTGSTKKYHFRSPVNSVFLSEEEFLSDQYRKERFICWSDGVCVFGKEFKFKAGDFPKPGTLLATLLNRDFLDNLETLKEDISQNTKITNLQLRAYCVKFAKIMMDFDFAIAMSNKPFYSSSRRMKMDYIKENSPLTTRSSIIEQIYWGKILIKPDNLITLIDTYKECSEANYQKMLDVEQNITRE